jgi:hypothetical protein
VTLCHTQIGSNLLVVFHETQELIDPFTNSKVSIDVGMVPLIKKLWDSGIRTVACCQGGEDADFVDDLDNWGYVYFHESVANIGKAKKIIELYGVTNLKVSFCTTDNSFKDGQRKNSKFWRWHIRFDPL